MREIRTSGSVGGEGGNILTYPAGCIPAFRFAQCGLLILTARSLGCLLDRRTGDRPVGAEHAAVARQGFEHFTTAFARIEEPARIRGHPFGRSVPAFRTGDGGFLDHLIASGLTGEPTAPVIGIAGATNMNS